MEERLSIEISATAQRVFEAVVYAVTNLERIDRRPEDIIVRRLPEGDIGRGTVIEMSGKSSPISLAAKFIEYRPPHNIKVQMHGLGMHIEMEYTITEFGEGCRLDSYSKPTHTTFFMKFANWLDKKVLKKERSLKEIKDLAESNQDLRV